MSQTVEITTEMFEVGTATLTAWGLGMLEQLCADRVRGHCSRVVVRAAPDLVYASPSDQKLTGRRVQAVEDFMVSNGFYVGPHMMDGVVVTITSGAPVAAAAAIAWQLPSAWKQR